MDRPSRSERWNLRVTEVEDAVVRRVIADRGTSLNEFVVAAAVERALDELADRRVLALDDAGWEQVQDLLDRSPAPNARLRRLLDEPSVLDRS
jgi:uncharacterized protein (DUF1778 family)